MTCTFNPSATVSPLLTTTNVTSSFYTVYGPNDSFPRIYKILLPVLSTIQLGKKLVKYGHFFNPIGQNLL